MRIGIIAALHESNTFASQPTTLNRFRADLLVDGENVRQAMDGGHHEVSGFFDVLDADSVDAVPILAARAVPAGPIDDEAQRELTARILSGIEQQKPLDGILFAAHGAAVSNSIKDLDGFWIERIRETLPDIPFIVTLDAHANLSQKMVENCTAIVAYRTNPHLDQRERGREAARLMLRTLRQEIHPTMAAAFPNMAISIQKQCTSDPHLSWLYEMADAQLLQDGVLSNSILLGFPYADVAEMGTSALVVTDSDPQLARELAQNIADTLWQRRSDFSGGLVDIESALDEAESKAGTIGLLDMGDNVGGGSAADGTELVAALIRRNMRNGFACIFDPEAVEQCRAAGIANRMRIPIGGKTDRLHGDPLELDVRAVAFFDGKFSEPQPMHGGISEFDQGETAIVTTDHELTLMLTSRRMVPFSLRQLTSCGIRPESFRYLVIKGVNAPIAAYRNVCQHFVHVNTRGSTCADMTTFTYCNRRPVMFPFENLT